MRPANYHLLLYTLTIKRWTFVGFPRTLYEFSRIYGSCEHRNYLTSFLYIAETPLDAFE